MEMTYDPIDPKCLEPVNSRENLENLVQPICLASGSRSISFYIIKWNFSEEIFCEYK